MSLLMLLLSLQSSSADSLEVIGGSLTYHLMGEGSENFSNKVSGDGRLIDNPLFGIQYTTEDKKSYESLAVFTGDNSVGTMILGIKASSGIRQGNLYLGFVLGAYEQDVEEFDRRGIIPFGVAKAGTTDVVPLLGIEVNYKLVSYRDTFVKINNVISPVLTNTTLSLGFSY